MFINHPKVNLLHIYHSLDWIESKEILTKNDEVIENGSLKQIYCLFRRIITHHFPYFQMRYEIHQPTKYP